MKYHSCKCSKKMPFLSVLLIKFLVACCFATLNRTIVKSLKRLNASPPHRITKSPIHVSALHLPTWFPVGFFQVARAEASLLDYAESREKT